MSEIGEAIALTEPHPAPEPKCPFCPLDPPKDFKTYPGIANDSDILGDIMENPTLLTEKQSNARPKTGKEGEQRSSKPQPKPNPIYSNSEYGDYSCEAHHLISGKQALAGHAIEKWIVADELIEKDTGYSVNNADNGIWLPSIPEKFKGGTWGPKSFDEKFGIASMAIDETKLQFHKGHHRITDPDDPTGEVHKSYDKYLKKKLTAIEERIKGWKDFCPLCEDGRQGKVKFKPTHKVNQVLDNFSKKIVRRKVSGDASRWDIFISKISLEYHKPRCTHKRTSL